MSNNNAGTTRWLAPQAATGSRCCHSRRAALVALATLFLSRPATAHTPYRQWDVYRKKHLVIGTDKSLEGSYPLGKQLASILAQQLPQSRARVSRAPSSKRIASLLSSGQFDIALLPRHQALALARGDPPFTDYGPVDLRVLYRSGDFVLVCRADFPETHAYLVVEVLVGELGETLQSPAEPDLPLHPGARDYLSNQP